MNTSRAQCKQLRYHVFGSDYAEHKTLESTIQGGSCCMQQACISLYIAEWYRWQPPHGPGRAQFTRSHIGAGMRSARKSAEPSGRVSQTHAHRPNQIIVAHRKFMCSLRLLRTTCFKGSRYTFLRSWSETAMALPTSLCLSSACFCTSSAVSI